ncbi:hypothetical protein YDYSY3_19710 [Paenibacillus chitinolyticus]|uniref:hypothetical protein n=1 Tax=Paenibacillus chitinolyticus TaxID=79263 RepID=UPI0026E4F0EC|nr:hypothetical protein [Paenibacillus chitinolyticus]GKS10971.1 hypothetical protein YDYSY3_19710 [Paenibacillus chitinolyticus]
MTALWGTLTLLIFGFLVVTVFIKSIQGARDQYGVSFFDYEEEEHTSAAHHEWMAEPGPDSASVKEWATAEVDRARTDGIHSRQPVQLRAGSEAASEQKQPNG